MSRTTTDNIKIISDGQEVGSSNPLPVTAISNTNTVSKYSAFLSTSGDNTVVTPSAGKKVILRWVCVIPSPDNANQNEVTIKLGTEVLYRCFAISKTQTFTGNVNESVVVNLQNSGEVAVNIHYFETT